MSLNAEQTVAVNAREGNILCIAGPGSGKTRVIVERYLKMLESGVSPDHILSLTFTKQAAKEMGQRGGFGSSQTVFRTFHSFALDFLKKERSHLSFTLSPEVLPEPNEQYEVTLSIVISHQNRFNYKELVEAISAYKRDGVSPEEAVEKAYGVEMFLASGYSDYEKKSRKAGWLDFDSIMWETVKLLESNEEVRARYQFKYVQVDEGQDTDTTQLRLLALITQNIFVVGDDNQLIYEWRSAKPGMEAQFSWKFPHLQKLFLGINYRSTKKIVEFVRQIVPVDNGLATHMVPGPDNPEGVDPSFTQYKHDFDEAEKIIASIKDPENSAVVVRTNRQIGKFQNLCMANNIKYRLLGKSGFWEQNEVKKLIQYIRDNQFKYMRLSAQAAVQSAVEATGILRRYRAPKKFGDNDVAENINDVAKVAARFPSTSEFLTHVNKALHVHKNRKGLILSTVHQMKGKEADHVYVASCCNGIMPHSKGELPEERRIFFVACSRAARFLHISYFGQPSPFILPFLKEETKNIVDQQKEIPGTQQQLF